MLWACSMQLDMLGVAPEGLDKAALVGGVPSRPKGWAS